jgi:hypothetical protein
MTSGHRETSMITSIVKADGADLYVERGGDGPPLLMIAGAAVTAGTYDPRRHPGRQLHGDHL